MSNETALTLPGTADVADEPRFLTDAELEEMARLDEIKQHRYKGTPHEL